MAVIFKDIIGFEGLYKIGSDGSVLSVEKKTNNQYQGGYYLKHFLRSGYPTVCLKTNGKSKYIAIHRLIAIHFIDNPFNKNQVNHKDGNKLNNDLSNLEWCTASENIQHAHDNRLIPKLVHTKEWKTMISKVGKNKAQKVKCLNDNIVYKNAREASEFYRIPVCSIWGVCSGKRNNVYGKIFKYEAS